MNPIRFLYNKLRYDLPIWLDNTMSFPWIRVYKHMYFTSSFSAQKEAVIRLYEIATGHSFNIDDPQTFNEKIQWLKLYWRNPLITQCADKFLVRDYIAQHLDESFLPKLLGVYDNPYQIDFDALPDKFVLKVNWGSGQNVICKDKSRLDIPAAIKKLKTWLTRPHNHYYYSMEWGYKNIPPKIICEEYLDFLDAAPRVYKVMCFNGEPKVIQLVMDDKTPSETINYYDTQWNLLPFKQNYPTNSAEIPRPKQLDQILEIAQKLSQPFPFVRVDLYEAPTRIYFSELTFYSDAGTALFDPPEWDKILGDYLQLPEPFNAENPSD